jgi:hypothetical protein
MSSMEKYTQFISEQIRKEDPTYIKERLSYKPVESDEAKKPADPARLGHGLDRVQRKATRVYKGGKHVATIRTSISHGIYTDHRIHHPDEEDTFGPKSRELHKAVEQHTGGSQAMTAYKKGLNKHFA